MQCYHLKIALNTVVSYQICVRICYINEEGVNAKN